MFCEKCGNNVNENEKFCEKCGTPVTVKTESSEKTVSSDFVAAPTAQAPKKPKKPMSPKLKKRIMISSIGAGVVAVILIVLFAVVVPILNRVNVADYLDISFNKDSLYEGRASVSFEIDSDQIYNKYFGNGKSNKNSDKKSDDMKSVMTELKDGYTSSYKKSAISTILSHCDVSAEIKDDSAKTEETQTTTLSGNTEHKANTTASVYRIKSDDVVVVKLTWDKDVNSKREIEAAEKKVGISFDKTDRTIEIKISDELKKNSLELAEAIEVDLVDYITKNNLAHIKGIDDGFLSFSIDDFEYEVGNYKFVYRADEYFGSKVCVVDKNEKIDESGTYKQNAVDIVPISVSEISYLNIGDIINLSIEAKHINNTNIFVTSTEKRIDVQANSPLTVDEAKNALESIKSDFTARSKDFSDAENVSISDIYLVSNKDQNSNSKNRVVVVYKYDSTDLFSSAIKESYATFVFTDAYMDGDNFTYALASDGSSYSKLSELNKYDIWLNDSNYTTTKIS